MPDGKIAVEMNRLDLRVVQGTLVRRAEEIFRKEPPRKNLPGTALRLLRLSADIHEAILERSRRDREKGHGGVLKGAAVPRR